MTNEDVQKIAKLREFIIGYYGSIEGKAEPTSVQRTQDVCGFCETLVKSLDDLLKEYVTFQ